MAPSNSVNWMVYVTAALNLFAGLYVGYSIGFPAVYMALDQMSTDCGKYRTPSACAANHAAACLWTSNNTCVFSDNTDCGAQATEDGCKQFSDYCRWSESDKSCEHLHGWTATESGLFASTMIIGGAAGCFPTGRVMDAIGRRWTFVALGLWSLVSCALMHAGRAVQSFPFFIAANILCGVPIGAMQVVAPMYVGEMAPAKYSFQIGMLIQVGITFGILLMGVVGFAMQPSDETIAAGANFDLLFQMSIAGLTALSAVFIPIGILLPESRKYEQAGTDAVDETNVSLPLAGVDIVNERCDFTPTDIDTTATVCGFKYINFLCFMVATALSSCLSLTGINSIIVYGPVILHSAGISALAANLLVTSWNFVTTLISLPLAFKFNSTRMFNAGAVTVTVTCCLAGILLYPGVIADETARKVLIGLAVFVFIAGFEIGMATPYYVIAQSMFPTEARSWGTGYTIGIQYVMNILVYFLYPIGLEAFSPTGGSQQRGFSLWFLIYGFFGILSTAVCVRYLATCQWIARTL
jgi:SP family arabinose:H+ symporter-like MFS transporter